MIDTIYDIYIHWEKTITRQYYNFCLQPTNMYFKPLKKRQIVYRIYAVFTISLALLFCSGVISLLPEEFPLAILLQQVSQQWKSLSFTSL